MPQRMDEPPGQPPTCVGAPEAGRILHITLGPNDFLVVAESEQSNGTHHDSRLLEQQTDRRKCEMKDCPCPGVKIYDRTWCCASCGEALIARICQEAEVTLPRMPQRATRPGQREKRKYYRA